MNRRSDPTITWKSVVVRIGGEVVVLRGRHDRAIARHAHDFFELQVAERGWAWQETTDVAADFTRGDVMLLRPGAWHRKTGCRGLVSWACCFPPAVLESPLAFLGADPLITALLGPAAPAARRIALDEACLRRVLAQLERLRAGVPPATALAILALVLCDMASALAPARRTGSRSHPGIAQAVAAFEAAPERPWSMAQVARHAGLSNSQFVRRFKACHGSSPSAYLQRRRIERASALLAETDLPISRIAARVGWKDPSLLARRFKANLGCTPLQWRWSARQRSDQ